MVLASARGCSVAVAAVTDAEGSASAEKQISQAIDTWVWYAGWTDKLTQVMGGLNDVAGPYFNITVPEPTGVAGIVVPPQPSLLGLVSRVAPALCGGNAVVILASEPHPLPAIELAECIQTADVPGGVVNILTGRAEELTPWLASHLDVDTIDVTGVPDEALSDVESKAAENVKRVVHAGAERSPYEATAFMEMKTVWHPKGP
jgi:acyl-CoA reductase-like NAD-dependent aldehyde dehydrogenase